MAKVGESISKVEREAVEYVMNFERSQGRTAVEVTRQGCDIISSGRKIEVKGKSDPWDGGARIQPQVRDVMIGSTDFFLYVVANIESADRGKYELYVLDKAAIQRHGRQWDGPWRVGVPKSLRQQFRVR